MKHRMLALILAILLLMAVLSGCTAVRTLDAAEDRIEHSIDTAIEKRQNKVRAIYNTRNKLLQTAGSQRHKARCSSAHKQNYCSAHKTAAQLASITATNKHLRHETRKRRQRQGHHQTERQFLYRAEKQHKDQHKAANIKALCITFKRGNFYMQLKTVEVAIKSHAHCGKHTNDAGKTPIENKSQNKLQHKKGRAEIYECPLAPLPA